MLAISSDSQKPVTLLQYCASFNIPDSLIQDLSRKQVILDNSILGESAGSREHTYPKDVYLKKLILWSTQTDRKATIA